MATGVVLIILVHLLHLVGLRGSRLLASLEARYAGASAMSAKGAAIGVINIVSINVAAQTALHTSLAIWCHLVLVWLFWIVLGQLLHLVGLRGSRLLASLHALFAIASAMSAPSAAILVINSISINVAFVTALYTSLARQSYHLVVVWLLCCYLGREKRIVRETRRISWRLLALAWHVCRAISNEFRIAAASAPNVGKKVFRCCGGDLPQRVA